MATTPNPNAPHIVLNVQPGAPSFTLNVGEGGCWVSFGDASDAAPTEDMFTGCEALGRITALPGSRIELADELDSQPFEKPADKPIDDPVRDAIAELGSNPDTDAITHLLPVDGFQVEVKVERVDDKDAGPGLTPERIEEIALKVADDTRVTLRNMMEGKYRGLCGPSHTKYASVHMSFGPPMEEDAGEEDAGPEYDTVSQDDIQTGDIVEYHDGDSVRRWAVLFVSKVRFPHRAEPEPYQAQIQLLDGPIHATEVVTLPLPGDPFILRPRS